MPQRSPKALARTSNADLQCQLLQRWPSLPAIIIEIRPKFVINNSSSEDLVLRDPETHLIWELKKNGTVTSPAIQVKSSALPLLIETFSTVILFSPSYICYTMVFFVTFDLNSLRCEWHSDANVSEFTSSTPFWHRPRHNVSFFKFLAISLQQHLRLLPEFFEIFVSCFKILFNVKKSSWG